MNDRQTEIYTEYEVIAQRVIADRLGIMTKSNRPGAPVRLLVELLGGELVVNGTKVVLDDLSRTRWAEGAILLMFLKHTSEANKFRLYGGSAGLFEVKDGRIESRLNHEEKDREVGALTLEQIVQLITPRRQ